MFLTTSNTSNIIDRSDYCRISANTANQLFIAPNTVSFKYGKPFSINIFPFTIVETLRSMYVNNIFSNTDYLYVVELNGITIKSFIMIRKQEEKDLIESISVESRQWLEDQMTSSLRTQ